MSLIVVNHKTKIETIRNKYSEVEEILDLTSKGNQPWVQFSPFYPHGGIPVPFSPGEVSASVEGIWQGLKVFEKSDVDPARFKVSNMKGLKRTVRTFGKVRGHREGLTGERLLPYGVARRVIYLPTYLWVLQNRLQDLVVTLKQMSADKIVVLLDYETNSDLDNLAKPLSHAGLVKRYIENDWPG